MGASISAVSASKTERTITFTYTAPAGGISNGSVTVAVPSGWPAPSITGSNAGYSTSSAGTLTVSASTITVASLTLARGKRVTLRHGASASSDPDPTAPPSTDAQTRPTRKIAAPPCSLTHIASQTTI